jgi:hypothetical protein
MGANYEKYGLNDQLQSQDSLAVKSDYTTAASFDSQYEGLSAIQIPDTFKIAKRGTLTNFIIGTEVGASSVIGTHNLGFIPVVFAWALIYSSTDAPNTIVALPYIDTQEEIPPEPGTPTPALVGQRIYYTAGSTTVSFINQRYPGTQILGAGTIDYAYYLMRETGGA